MSNKPNFFIVGAPKSGTTSMYNYLKVHPDIFMPEKVKEPHYFAPDFRPLRAPLRSLEEYLALFDGARDEKRIGEASVWYLYAQDAAQRIHEFSPDAKIVAMLRNPAEMMQALYFTERIAANETLDSFEEAVAREADRKRGIGLPARATACKLYYRDAAHYAEQLERYFECFGRENVHVIIFDDFVKDTAGVYRKLLEFLEVDPDFQTEFVVYNQHMEIQSQALNRLIMRPPPLVKAGTKLWSRLVPRKVSRASRQFARKIRKANFRAAKRPPLNPETRRQLLADMQPEIVQLGQLLGRDLTYWYNS